MFKLNDELDQVIIQRTQCQCYKIATGYHWQTDGDGQFDQQLPKHRTGISLGKKEFSIKKSLCFTVLLNMTWQSASGSAYSPGNN
jgi:hypothetical protein